MNITIKSLKFSEAASDETNFFSCKVLVDGKQVAEVSNGGTGGENMWYPRSAKDPIDAFAKATIPNTVYDFNDPKTGKPAESEADADTIIDDLVANALTEKDFKRLVKNRLLFVTDGKLYESKTWKPDMLQSYLANPEHRAKLSSQNCLNVLAFEEGLAIYRKMGGG